MTAALTTPSCTPAGRSAARRTPDSDAAVTRLALDARDGDPVKTDRFVRALHRDVWRYVAYLSADTQAADDLTQDVFLRALASLHRFEGRSSARTWLLSIARRTVVDSLRHAAARPRLSDRCDWQTAAEQTQPYDVPGFEDGIALAELLAVIPSERREALVLTQLLGLSYAEAATAVGCPIGTVRSRVARARTSLIELLSDTRTTEPAPEPAAPRHDRSGERVLTAAPALA
ncbi:MULTISPECIES: sigma-70 family RNA polymerase sigma factor [Streptomyces]|uniref:RNA polymerase sigma factor n=1 Tax=Streptomyces spororaveus TaxID=284039 RepID=A0ABQ3T7U7_9ACTN|nr:MULTISPECIES: sigma-70 family RNA polymerase sigma factor [Streptomyces]MCM9083280.1 sigma-70 family RNA polymerase sigma factor [Streptomyces spororaveus]MCX5302120.1 sigma-70 family RNA polymerase sigma factor [Streptomyces sp. NBC_00160]GHI76451.1 RNA polymerase sigma factor [Streptomyces spororaveus]